MDAILSGHLHRYERRTVDGVRAFTVGTGGGPIGADEFTRETAGAEVSLTEFGHLRIDVEGPRVRYTFVNAGRAGARPRRGLRPRRDPVILRLVLLAAGLAALAGSIAIDRPERFAITAPSALVVFVVGAGAIAADALPLRRAPLACSIATVLLGLALIGSRGETQIPMAAGIVVLQAIAIAAARRPGGATG